MQLLHYLIDWVVHLDRHLDALVQATGYWTYLVLFAVIFCETGLVITPFLPGDSLLFALGALAALGTLNLPTLWFIMCAAAIIGDSVNYQIGHYLGPKALNRPDSRILKKEYLDRTHRFFEKYGGRTIILARFVPIVRTFAPFVAGVGTMTYGKFLLYNIVGGVAWVTLFLAAGYFFGNIPVVKRNFTLVILAIIILSVLPMVYEYWRARREGKRASQTEAADQPVHSREVP